ncbi:hypothetical protein [Pseudoxanthomonas suwonensis]|uniref:Uncharacterized protein n=1 Tax=Pseudoxanthomonas suwonensis TaxID=314722 RepID=A0A0E3Z114_9GAMM|nr:hypothetical protein [Pseudoxanthomonas suwonensis]AKC86873.1 hypothetical protein WQ53_09020 [Pseudoxanthomonas suwonensis]
MQQLPLAVTDARSNFVQQRPGKADRRDGKEQAGDAERNRDTDAEETVLMWSRVLDMDPDDVRVAIGLVGSSPAALYGHFNLE